MPSKSGCHSPPDLLGVILPRRSTGYNVPLQTAQHQSTVLIEGGVCAANHVRRHGERFDIDQVDAF